MNKITPFLWYNDQAEEAARFYVSLFDNSKITSSSPMYVSFVLDGQEIMALNGGPEFKFTEAISLFVSCEDQAEVDKYWDALIDNGGSEGQRGWLKDKFGLSWQIIPNKLHELLEDPDPKKSGNVMVAMRKMQKIIVADLLTAYNSG